MFVCIYMCKCRHTYSYIFPNMYPKGLENPPKKERGFCMEGLQTFLCCAGTKIRSRRLSLEGDCTLVYAY